MSKGKFSWYKEARDEERDRIRRQVEKLRDEAKGYLKLTNKKEDHVKNGVLSARIHAFVQVLAIIDGES